MKDWPCQCSCPWRHIPFPWHHFMGPGILLSPGRLHTWSNSVEWSRKGNWSCSIPSRTVLPWNGSAFCQEDYSKALSWSHSGMWTTTSNSHHLLCSVHWGPCWAQKAMKSDITQDLRVLISVVPFFLANTPELRGWGKDESGCGRKWATEHIKPWSWPNHSSSSQCPLTFSQSCVFFQHKPFLFLLLLLIHDQGHTLGCAPQGVEEGLERNSHSRQHCSYPWF